MTVAEPSRDDIRKLSANGYEPEIICVILLIPKQIRDYDGIFFGSRLGQVSCIRFFIGNDYLD